MAAIAAFSIMGCKEDDGKKDPYKLTVTNITSGITAATLVDQATSSPVATALAGSGGTFTFYEPNANNMPDSTKPFRTKGSYAVILLRVNISTQVVTGAWMSASKQVSGNFTLDFVNDFNLIQDLTDYNSASAYKMTVTNIPASTTVTAASLMPTAGGDTPIATAINFNGTFAFFEPRTDMLPDTTKPFKSAGLYMIMLAQMDLSEMQVSKVWASAQSGTPAPVQISGNFNLDFVNDFVEQQLGP